MWAQRHVKTNPRDQKTHHYDLDAWAWAAQTFIYAKNELKESLQPRQLPKVVKWSIVVVFTSHMQNCMFKIKWLIHKNYTKPKTRVDSTTCDIIMVSSDHSYTNFNKNNKTFAEPEIIQETVAAQF